MRSCNTLEDEFYKILNHTLMNVQSLQNVQSGCEEGHSHLFTEMSPNQPHDEARNHVTKSNRLLGFIISHHLHY